MVNPPIWTLALVLLMISCAKRPLPAYHLSNDAKFPFEDGQFVGETAYYVRFYPNGNLMRMGQYAFRNDGQLSQFQTGKWAEYYQNGQVREMGEYALGRYIYCGYVPFRKFYHYKTGYWRYYHANGNLKAIGQYKPGSFTIENCCEGGAALTFGLVNCKWKFYDLTGNEITPDEELVREIERVAIVPEYGWLYRIPDRATGNVREEIIPE